MDLKPNTVIFTLARQYIPDALTALMLSICYHLDKLFLLYHPRSEAETMLTCKVKAQFEACQEGGSK